MTDTTSKKTNYAVSLDRELHGVISTLAKASGRTHRQVVRDAITVYTQLFACKSCSTVAPKKETRNA